MINLWEQKLAEYFKTNMELDAETEEIRKKLVTRVSQQKLFEAIDKDSNGFLTINEFVQAIQRHNRPFSLKFLRRMIKLYDKNGDFSLDYNDFGSFLLPKEYKDDYNKTEIDVNDTNYELFIDLVVRELEAVQMLSEMAEEIKKTKEFIPYEGFRSIAGTSKFITELKLKEFLIKKGIEVKDMNILAKVIYRYDKNFDGHFGYDEFKDIFSPISSEDNNDADSDNHMNIIAQVHEKDYAKQGGISLKNKMSLRSSNETQDDSNLYLSKCNKNKTMMYDYSFDQEVQNGNDLNEQEMKPQYLASSIVNPFKKSLNNLISLTKSKKVDRSPIEKQLDSSNYDMMNSNSMLNNSFMNVSFSPNRSIIMNQQYLDKERKPSPQSPLKKLQKQLKKNKVNHSISISSPSQSNSNRTYLLNYLNEIVVKELICENIREEMSKSPEINIPDLFSFFDHSHRIKISPSDFQESLKRISITVPFDQLNLLFKKFDKDNDGYLNYSEFCELILPRSSTHAHNLSKHVPPESYMVLSPKAIHFVSNLFYSVLACVKGCESIRRENASKRDYSNVDCYELMKSKRTNSIFKKDLEAFLKDNKVMMTPFETEILMDYFDKDKDGQITFKEFVKETSPRGIVV